MLEKIRKYFCDFDEPENDEVENVDFSSVEKMDKISAKISYIAIIVAGSYVGVHLIIALVTGAFSM